MTSVVDPLGGSYYVEALTDRIEAEVFDILGKVDAQGGTVAAIEAGWFQREIAESAYAHARRRASGERPVVALHWSERAKWVDATGSRTCSPVSVPSCSA